MSDPEDLTVDQQVPQLEDSRRISHEGPPQLPNYQLDRLLGRGSFGTVWAGVQVRTGVQVAVKVLHRTALGWDSFRQEVDTLRQVAEHPGVVTLLDAELDHDPPFFVMPWLRRGSLADLPQRPTLKQAVQWFREAAQALQYTHDKGILHCDIKPSNLLLDEEGHVRLVDFGQSLLHDGAGRSLGTIGFMPPEQLQGPPNVRWDIYSLGATAYFLLTGQVPRLSQQDRSSLSSGTTQQRTQLYLDLMHDRPLLSSRDLNPQVDVDLAAIVESCLALDPARRTPVVSQILEDLDHRQQGDPLLCCRPWSIPYRLGKLLRKPVVALALFGVLALSGLGTASWIEIQLKNRQLNTTNRQMETVNHQMEAVNRRLTSQGIGLRWQAGVVAEEQQRPETALSWWSSLLRDLPDDAGLRLLLGTSHRFPLLWRELLQIESSEGPQSLRPKGLLAFSQDGQQLACSLPYARNSRVDCWDAASGRLLWHSLGVLKALVSGADQRWLLTFEDRLELRHGRQHYTLPGEVRAAALDQAGDAVEVLTLKGSWVTWKPEQGELLRLKAGHLPMGSSPLQWVEGPRRDNGLWNLGQHRRIVKTEPGSWPGDVTHDGRWAVWLRGNPWEYVLLNTLSAVTRHWPGEPARLLYLRPDGKVLVAATRTRLLAQDVTTHKVLWQIPSEVEPTDLNFDPSGELLLVGGEGWAQILDRHGRIVGGPWGTPIDTAAARFSPSGDRLAILSSEGQLEVHQVTSSLRWLSDGNTTAVAWSPDGRVSCGHPVVQVETWDGPVRKWTKRVKTGYPPGLVTHVDRLSWTRDGRILVASLAIAQIRENPWDRSVGRYLLDARGQQTYRIPGPGGESPEPYSVSPDGRFGLVYGKVSADRQSANPPTLKSLQAGASSPLLGAPLPGGKAYWSSDAQFFAIASSDGLSLWNPARPDPLWRSPFDASAPQVAVAPEGDWVAAAQGNQIHLYAGPTGLRENLSTGSARVGALWFSPGGDFLLAGTMDGRVLITSLSGPRKWSQIGPNQVTALAFHPKMPWLALGTKAGLRLYHLTTHRPVSGLAPGVADCRDLAFSPAGSQLLIGSGVGAAIWTLAAETGPAESLRQRLEHDAGCALDADDQTVPQPQVPALGPDPK